MQAFVMKEIGKVGFVEKPMPKPGPGDAIIKTTKRRSAPLMRTPCMARSVRVRI